MYTWYNRIEKRLVFDYSRLKLSETVWKMRASNQKVREIYRRFVPLHAMISLNGKCYVVDSTVLVLYCANIHLLLGVFFRERLVDSNSKENLAIEVEMTLPCPLHYFSISVTHIWFLKNVESKRKVRDLETSVPDNHGSVVFSFQDLINHKNKKCKAFRSKISLIVLQWTLILFNNVE